MIGSNKILTVSYGTFSCTLEGFDDSFETMKSIAEYFRDLAADDRYFGAEPPQPDTDTLARIAEQNSRSRVHAVSNDGGVTLRPVPTQRQLAEVEEIEQDPEPGGQSAPSSDSSSVTPIAAGTAVAGAAALAAGTESVSDKLARIRDVVGRRSESASDDVEFEEEPSLIADNGSDAIFTDHSDEPVAVVELAPTKEIEDQDVTVEDNEPEAASASDDEQVAEVEEEPAESHEPEVAAEADEEETVEADVTEDQDDTTTDGDSTEAVAETEAEVEENPSDATDIDLAAVSEAVSEMTDESPEPEEQPEEEPLVLSNSTEETSPDAAPEEAPAVRRVKHTIGTQEASEQPDTSDVEPQEEQPAASGISWPTDPSLADFSAPVHDIPSMERPAPLQLTDPVAESSDSEDAKDESDEGDFETALAEIEAAITDDTPAEVSGNQIEEALAATMGAKDETEEFTAEVIQDSAPEADASDSVSESDETVETDSDDEDESPKNAGVVAALAGAAAATSPIRAGITRLRRNSETPVIQHPSAKMDAPVEDAAEDSNAQDTDLADLDGLPDAGPATPLRLDTPSLPARTARGSSDMGTPDISRLMDQADAEMSEPAGNRRRQAIAHLKAAVAATEAARRMGDPVSSRQNQDKPFRDDLDSIVRPRRPQTDGAKSPRPEQSVEGERSVTPLNAETVAPRRVEGRGSAPQQNLPEAFANYCETVGARSIEAKVEAALAFLVDVDGQEYVTRPWVIALVRDTDETAFDRETALRAFGTLLRDRRMDDLGQRRFGVTDRTRYRLETASNA